MKRSGYVILNRMGVVMKTEQNQVELYRGYEIVAKCLDTSHQGVAWAKKTGLKKLSAEGSSCSEVIKKLCKEIDIELQPSTAALGKTLPERHREYLSGLGKPDAGLRAASLIRPHRVSACYQCGEPVDNKVDFECAACGWIVCNSCAACGCGHETPAGSNT
jgi:hypothetical protein